MRSVKLLLMVVVLWAGAARAQEDVSAQARTLYERGMAHFQLAEYDDAIAKWQEGFRLKPVPEFLYNIGQAYRLSNRPDKAVQAYRAYLRMSPKAENKAEVERHIVALQRVLDQSKQAANAPPTSTTPVKPAPSEPPATTPPVATQTPPPTEPPPTSTPPPTEPAHNELTASAPPREKPVTKRAWFWPVVIGGAAIVVGAVVVGVVVGTRDNTKTLPGLTF